MTIKNDSPLVSIIISCFNHEQFIDDCMESLCCQTYKNIEVLIIDDCSVDNSFRILLNWEERLRERFVNVKIERNEVNRGLVRNLNKMISTCNGVYIKDLASDDFLPENAVADLVEYAMTTQADVVFSNSYFVNEKDKRERLHFPLRTYYKVGRPPKHGRNLTSSLLACNFICAPTTLIPKTTYERYGLYKEELYFEDFEFWLRVSIDGNIEYLDKVTSYYRVRSRSLSHFASVEDDYLRQKVFYKEKCEILSLYSMVCTQKDKRGFYNNELAAAIGSNNFYLVNEILGDMKQSGLRLSYINFVKLFLFRINVYQVVRKIKRF